MYRVWGSRTTGHISHNQNTLSFLLYLSVLESCFGKTVKSLACPLPIPSKMNENFKITLLKYPLRKVLVCIITLLRNKQKSKYVKFHHRRFSPTHFLVML